MKPGLWLLVLASLFSACNTRVTPVDREVPPDLRTIPVYPESMGWSTGIPGVNQESETSQTCSYIASVFKYKTLMNFYEEEMADDGWKLLEKSEDSKTNSAELKFARSKTVAYIQMIPWTANSYLVYVVFYVDPVVEE